MQLSCRFIFVLNTQYPTRKTASVAQPGCDSSFIQTATNIQWSREEVAALPFFIHPMDIPCWLLDIQSLCVVHKPPVLGNNLKMHVTLL